MVGTRYSQYVSNSGRSEFASVVFVDVEERGDDDAVGKLASSEALLSFLTLRDIIELHVDLCITHTTHQLRSY